MRLIRNIGAASVVEYSILLSLIGALSIGAIFEYGGKTRDGLNSVNNTVSTRVLGASMEGNDGVGVGEESGQLGQGSQGDGEVVVAESDPCVGSVGAVCADGTVFAGEFGGAPLFTTATDQGALYWNNGTYIFPVETGATSMSDGWANTNILVALTDAGAPYVAANTCRNLGADWYLPSWEELNVLYTNRFAIGGFNTTGEFYAGYYWSSTDVGGGFARSQYFLDGVSLDLPFDGYISVRCVRRG